MWNNALPMHELPITQGILQVALDTAQQNSAQSITDICLVIGAMSSIVDDSVQFYFDILSRETAAAGARLHFRRIPATATCWHCQHQFEVIPPLAAECPVCGSAQLQVTGGREFYVESIEIE
jgi:hydrogenase nickel incorporation protein HypA/HybF